MDPGIQTRYQSLGPEYFWLEIRYSLTRWLLKRYSRMVDHRLLRDRLLDIGCGPGNCLRGVPHRLQCYGTDVAAEPLRVTRAVSGASTFVSNIVHLPVRDRSLGYTILLDVAEHVDGDVQLFRETHRVLCDSGYVFVTVPASQCLWGHHDTLYGHKRRYSKRELNRKLREAGFDVLEIRYLLPLMFFPLFLMRQWKRLRKNKTDDFFELSPLLNSLLTTYLFVEATLCRFLPAPWGVILYAVGRRSHREASTQRS